MQYTNLLCKNVTTSPNLRIFSHLKLTNKTPRENKNVPLSPLLLLYYYWVIALMICPHLIVRQKLKRQHIQRIFNFKQRWSSISVSVMSLSHPISVCTLLYSCGCVTHFPAHSCLNPTGVTATTNSFPKVVLGQQIFEGYGGN